jgi:hypothetical protein
MAFIALIFAYIKARWSKLFGVSAYKTAWQDWGREDFWLIVAMKDRR